VIKKVEMAIIVCKAGFFMLVGTVLTISNNNHQFNRNHVVETNHRSKNILLMCCGGVTYKGAHFMGMYKAVL
jgi:hypothetical protein